MLEREHSALRDFALAAAFVWLVFALVLGGN